MPNRICRDCGARLHFQPPAQPLPAWMQAVDRALESWSLRIALMVVGITLAVLQYLPILIALAVIAFVLYIARPPSVRPRCPRCGGLRVEEPTLEECT